MLPLVPASARMPAHSFKHGVAGYRVAIAGGAALASKCTAKPSLLKMVLLLIVFPLVQTSMPSALSHRARKVRAKYRRFCCP